MPDFFAYGPEGPIKLMATSSERVPVKLKIGGVKYRGVIVQTVVDTALSEATMGLHRSWVPGMRSETLIVEVPGPMPSPESDGVKLKIAGVKSRGVITNMTWQGDGGDVTVRLTIEIVS